MRAGNALITIAIAAALLGITSAQGFYTTPLTASVSNQNVQINMGQSTVITLYISGGQGPYTVQAVAAATQSTLNTQSGVAGVYSYQFVPTNPGKYTIIFYITDQQKNEILETATIQVLPTYTSAYGGSIPLTVSAAPSQTTTQAGQSASVTVIPSGGTPGYTINVYVNGVYYTQYKTGGTYTSVTPYTFTYTPPQPGVYNLGFIVYDSAGAQKTTLAQITATPNPFQEQSGLQVSVTPAYGTTSVGNTLPISVAVSGGVPPYTVNVYQQSSTPTLSYTMPNGQTSYTYTFQPSSAGNYVFTFVVTDKNGNSQTGLATVDVGGYAPGQAAPGGPFGVTVSPSTVTAAPGQQVQISINPVGGTAPYAIVLYIGGVYQQEFVSTGEYTYAYTPSVPGTATLDFKVFSAGTSVDGFSTVTVTGSGSYTSGPYGGSSSGTAAAPSSPLTVSVSPQQATVNAGQSTSVQVTPSGGVPPYTVFVYDNGVFKTEQQNINGGSYTYTFTPTMAGQTENIGIKIVDSGTGIITSYSSISVQGSQQGSGQSGSAPLAATVSPQSTTVTQGQTTQIQVTPSGGTPPYYLFFYDNGAFLTEISQVTGSYTYSFTPSTSTMHNIGIKIVDSGTGFITAFSSINAQSTTTVTTTIPPSSGTLSVAVSPQSTSMSAGQSTPITITPSGGVGPYYIFIYADGSYVTELPAISQSATYAYATTLPGTHNIGIKVLDSDSSSATSFATVVVH